MDRRDHLLMNYANRFDRLPIKEQEALALLVGPRASLIQQYILRQIKYHKRRRFKIKNKIQMSTSHGRFDVHDVPHEVNSLIYE
jgi:hypothetical protein